MSKKNTHTLNESDLKRMISKVLKESLDNEAFLGIDFGIDERQRNRVNTFKYARLYAGLVQQVEKIAAELGRRVQILQGAQGQQPVVNEGLVGAAVKGVSKYGLKNGLKGAAKVAGKKAWKRTMYAGLAATAAFFAGIPQAISQRIQEFKNPAQTKPQDVIQAYGELAEWMGEMCQAVQENPAILGAAALQDSTLNGPGEVDSGPFMTAGEGAGLAASLGMAAVGGPIGLAAAAVFDVIDIASMLVSAGAKQDEEGLKMVEKQYQYLNVAIKDMNQALAQSAQAQPQYKPQQQPVQQQAQTGTQKRQLPNGYAVGRPAPFANSDPQQVMRFQQYVGISPTGKWDNNTQVKWNNWLQQTYQIV